MAFIQGLESTANNNTPYPEVLRAPDQDMAPLDLSFPFDSPKYSFKSVDSRSESGTSSLVGISARFSMYLNSFNSSQHTTEIHL